MGAGQQNLWGIVLAGGEEERLRGFVREHLGTSAPKQFCAFSGRRTMVGHTLHRAEMIIPRERLVVVATARHRPYVFSALGDRPPGTVLLQPVGRDTGPGILLPLVHILHRDPDALVAVFPSDHFVMPGRPFMEAVSAAAGHLAQDDRTSLVLLAVRATDAETEYGWVKSEEPPGEPGPGTVERVVQFIEKPHPELARKLLAEGWLWNTMVMVARAKALLTLVRRACPELAAHFSMIRRAIGSSWETEVLNKVYRMMPCVNFSASVLTRCPEELFVLPVGNVLWSDWGRGERILATLQRAGLTLSSFAQTGGHAGTVRREAFAHQWRDP